MAGVMLPGVVVSFWVGAGMEGHPFRDSPVLRNANNPGKVHVVWVTGFSDGLNALLSHPAAIQAPVSWRVMQTQLLDATLQP